MRNFILAAALALVGQVAPAATLPWTDLVVFGDSLSDAGNLGGFTFTNGQTWAGLLGAAPSNAGGLNYAYGGARAVSTDALVGPAPGFDVPDFAEQRAAFAADAPTLGADPLVVAWFGGNDLLNAGGNPAAIGQAVAAIGAGVFDLAQSAGLTRFLLPNLPDLSRIPLYADAPEAVRAGARLATLGFNGGLEALAGTLRGAGLDVEVFDTKGLFDMIFADPGAFGFDEPLASTCLQGMIDCDGFLFWDPIHPTQAAHMLVRDAIVAQAQPAPVPLPAAGWLLFAGMGGLFAFGRREAIAA